jgi:hypothetical protein
MQRTPQTMVIAQEAQPGMHNAVVHSLQCMLFSSPVQSGETLIHTNLQQLLLKAGRAVSLTAGTTLGLRVPVGAGCNQSAHTR